jgi:CAAX protease family protein
MMQVPPRPDRPGLPPLLPGPGEPVRLAATWQWWEILLVFFGALAAGVTVATVVFALAGSTPTQGPADSSALGFALVTAFVSTGVVWLWMDRQHPGWGMIVGWPSWGHIPKELVVGGLLGLVVRFAAGVAAQVLVEVLSSASGRTVELPEQVSTNLSGPGIALFVVYAVVVAPAGEELLFRGLLYRSIRDRYGVAIGAIGSAIPFGLLHFVAGQPWPDLIALPLTMTVTGVGLALIHERRGNLLANIAGHSAFNLVAVVVTVVSAAR